MLTALEQGINQAIAHDLRRVVMCVDGLRSHNLQWEAAERPAVNAMAHLANTMSPAAASKGLVIVTTKKLHEDRKTRVLAAMAEAERKQSKDSPKSDKEDKKKQSPQLKTKTF